MGDNEDDKVEFEPVAGKASQDALADLHGNVAAFLNAIVLTGKASPAFIGAAITFLKNNSITADPATNAALANLSATLAARKNKGMTRKQVGEAEEAFASIMGGFPQ